jgi:Immunoglobulin domain/Immunoglobulin I-set domain
MRMIYHKRLTLLRWAASLLIPILGNAAPVIVEQPSDVTAKIGEAVTFSVLVSGNGSFLYQWRLNGQNINGATDNIYEIPRTQLSDGGAYTVAVSDGKEGVLSDHALLTIAFPRQDGGDDFEKPTEIKGVSGTIAGQNLQATRQPGEPLHADKPGVHSVWYLWRALNPGIVTFHTRGSAFDTLLAAYKGDSLTALTPLAGDDDSGGFHTSEIRFNVSEGGVYQIAIDGLGEAQGDFLLSWSFEATSDMLPVIIQQPLSQTVRLGSVATFSVEAQGKTLSYQWFLNGQPVNGAIAPSLTVRDVQPRNVGDYTVWVLNERQRLVVSRTATLEIGRFPDVQSQDKIGDLLTLGRKGLSGAPGLTMLEASAVESSAFFSVAVGSTINQTLNNTGATEDDGVAPHCGIVGGADKWITLTPTEDGVCQIDTLGSALDTVVAVYRWTGSILTTLTNIITCNNDIAFPTELQSLVQFQAPAGAVYWVALDGRMAAMGDIEFNLKFGLPPQSALTGPPPTRIVRKGDGLTLNAGFQPNAFPPTYQWRRNGLSLGGKVNESQFFGNLQIGDTGVYSVRAENWAGTAVNVVATVLVDTMSVENVHRNESGQFQFEVVGDVGQHFIIEASTDMEHWDLLREESLTLGNPVYEFIDNDTALYPIRFYRVLPVLP